MDFKPFKVNFGDKYIYLIDKEDLNKIPFKKFVVFIFDEKNFIKKFEQIAKNNFTKKFIFTSNKISKDLIFFLKSFVHIIAAGGIVKNSKNEVLLIYRNNKWDLPKGKLEKNESIEECAIREVQEETGVFISSLDKLLEITYHIYFDNKKYFLKETHWYSMYCNNDSTFAPQKNEGIEKCEWVNDVNLKIRVNNTYKNIKYLLNEYTLLLN